MAHVLRSVHTGPMQKWSGARCPVPDVQSVSSTCQVARLVQTFIFSSQCHVSTEPGLTSITFAVCPRPNSTYRSPYPVPTCTLLEGGFLPDAMMILNMPMPAFSLASGVSQRLSSWVFRPYKGGRYPALSVNPLVVCIHHHRYISLCHVPRKRSSHVSFWYYTFLVDRYFCSSGHLEVRS